MKKIVIIGGGLSGLECARTLVENDYSDLIVLERNSEIIRKNSWKTFERTVKKFGLEACIASNVAEIYLRAVDVDSSEIIGSNSIEIKALVLDSMKVYEKLLQNITSYVKTDSEVIKIEKEKKGYIIFTKNNKYEADIIIDASGVEFLTENLLSNKEFESNAFFLCYGKRFANCNANIMRNIAFFDFDSPFKLNGTWCYQVDENTVEIGVSRFTNSYEMDSEEILIELEELFEKYKKLEPFNDVLKNAAVVDIIRGYCSLLPRVKIKKENIYIVGDAKGAVSFSGYGVENALESGRQCALSIIKNKKYKYYVTSPSRGLAGLKIVWGLKATDLRNFASSIVKDLGAKRALKFFTGEMTFSFFLHCLKITRKHNIKITDYVSKGLLIRALLNLKPKKKHYASFIFT